MTFDWRRLPDPEHLARLERVAADYFGVGSGHVCAVPGSEIGLRLVGTLIGGAARHVVPGYRPHGEMIPESAPTGWDEARDAGGNLTLANPNNPDGRAIAAEAVRALFARSDGRLQLAEAFRSEEHTSELTSQIRTA